MHDFSKALRDRDIAAILESFSADVIYHSPIMRPPFTGNAVAEILEIFCEVVTVDHLQEFGSDDTLVLVATVTVGSRTGDATWVVRLDKAGKVCEIGWQARPFGLVARIANAFAAGLAARRGGVKPALAAAGKPLILLVANTIDLFGPLIAPPGSTPRPGTPPPAPPS